MLKAGVTIEVDPKLSLSRFNVNELVRGCQNSNLKATILGELINQYQEEWLDKNLGIKNSGFCVIGNLICPRCESSRFTRRGSRPRQLKSSVGLIRFKLYQVTCLDCSKTHSPFMEYLCVKPRQRITDELEVKLINLVKDLSYQESSRKAEQLLSVKVSGFSIHRIVKRKVKELTVEDVPKVQAMMLDATKVIVNTKIKHEELKVIMGVNGRTKQGNRYVYDKRIISLACEGSWWSMQEEVKASKPAYVMCDGDHTIEKMTRKVLKHTTRQWCLWHVPRSVYYRTLWRDGLPWEERFSWVEQLKIILFDQTSPLSIVKEKLNRYIQLLKEANLFETARYLHAYQKYYFGYRTQTQKDIQSQLNENKPLVTTAVIERLMREIKRRTRVGVRWTSKGLVNLLRIKLVYEYNKENFQKLWNFPLENNCSISFNVNVLNVKIT